MRDYLIVTDDSEFLGPVHSDRQADVLLPAGWAAVPVAGDGEFRISVLGAEIEFYWEQPGLQIAVDGTIDDAVVERVIATIARQVGAELSVRTRVVPF